MKTTKNSIFVRIVCVALVCGLGVYGAYILKTTLFAQGVENSLTLSPGYIIDEVNHGGLVESKQIVTNNKEKLQDLTVTTVKVVLDDRGNYDYEEVQGDFPISQIEADGWIEITPRKFTLEPGESQEISITINFPEELPTNGYYFEIFVTPDIGDSPGEQKVGFESEIRIPVAINYIGDEPVNEELDLVAFDTDKDWYEYVPVKMYTQIVNRGNVHVIPHGEIFIKGGLFNNDETLQVIEINEQGSRVMVDSGKVYEDTWTGGFIYFDNEGKVRVNWSKIQDFRIGKYTAYANIVWDKGSYKEVRTASADFWIIPWKIILGFVAIVAIIIGCIAYKFQSSKKSKSRSPKVAKSQAS